MDKFTIPNTENPSVAIIAAALAMSMDGREIDMNDTIDKRIERFEKAYKAISQLFDGETGESAEGEAEPYRNRFHRK